MRELRPFLCLAVFLIALSAMAQDVASFSVSSRWGGLGTPQDGELRLTRSGTSLHGHGETLRPEQFKGLIEAVGEPALSKPSARNLGIDAAWLKAHAAVAGMHASMLWYDSGSQAQKALFDRRFEDESTLQKRLDVVYNGSHTDDYPSISFVIVLADGTRYEAHSYSQNPLMLPWCVGAKNDCVKTYNAHISEALASLLPKKFANRERLLPSDDFGSIAANMGMYMSGDLEREWNLLGVEGKAPAALKAIREHFTVRYADINTWNDLSFNEVPNTGKPVEENLQVILWRRGLPEGMTIEAQLLSDKGQVQGVADLEPRANRYADKVLGVEWLTKFLMAHPKERASVNYVHGVSMTDKAMRIFAADMREVHRNDLVQRVRDAQQEAALLSTGGGEWWIVMPDHTMILWRWASLRPILKWQTNTFPSERCTDYQSVSGGCAGIVISPQGEIGR